MNVGRYPPTFVYLGPLRIFIQPSSEIAAKPTNSLTHSECSMIGGSLAYSQSLSMTRDVLTIMISGLTMPSLTSTISLSLFKDLGDRGPKRWRRRTGNTDVPGVARREWLDPQVPQDPCLVESAAPNNSRNLGRPYEDFFENVRCCRHS